LRRRKPAQASVEGADGRPFRVSNDHFFHIASDPSEQFLTF
jgi:hypothetical protein